MSAVASTSKGGKSRAAPKIGGVFANDGSFMSKFAKRDEDDQERMAQTIAAARKKALDDKIRYRGKKRTAPAAASAQAEPDSKRPRTEAELAYAREVAELRRHSELKDRGSGALPCRRASDPGRRAGLDKVKRT